MGVLCASIRRSRFLIVVVATIEFTARAAAAQYAARVLVPPASLPASTPTDGFAMNSAGQVYGDARTATGRVPLVWTNGVPQILPIPDGHFWDVRAGQQFFNDAGTAITRISSPSALPGGVLNQILRWNSAGAFDIVPATPPSALAPQGCSAEYVQFYPMGLNNAGHVLILATDASGGCPWILWIWDGLGATPDHFHELTLVAGDATGCPAQFVARFDSGHLADQDHVATMFGAPNQSCANPQALTAGILAGGSYTPEITLIPAGGGVFGVSPGTAAVNNHDQLVAFVGDPNAPELLLWDGHTVVDLGAGGGVAMNDLGHVLFSAHVPGGAIVRLYKNGAVADVPIPTDIPGFVLAAGAPTSIAINTTGQLLLSMNFLYSNAFSDQAVVLTPMPPTVTLRVNGQHPSPPIVTTAGAMVLTLDVSASAYTAPVSWFWAFLVGNQIVWITPGGAALSPAPLAVTPPVPIANATLVNTTLAPGSTIVTLFLLVDGGGHVVASDVVEAMRP